MSSKPIVALLLAVAAVALFACGDDESDQELAQNQVCDARADIEKQVDELESLQLSTATLDGIKQNLSAITDGLETMREALPELSEERRQEVESATKTFTSQVGSVVDDLGSGTSLSSALTQVQNSLVELRDGYQQALEPIECS